MEKIDYLLDKTNKLDTELNESNKNLSDISISVSANQNNIQSLRNNYNDLSSKFYNSNILLNGNFEINQRGFGSNSSDPYTTANGTAYLKKYTFDRWAIVPQNNVNANNSVYKNSDGSITITFGQRYVYFIQQLENSTNHSGKTYTCSVKVNSLSNTSKLAIAAMDHTSGSGVQLGYANINKTGIISFTFTTLSTTTDLRIRIVYANSYSEDVSINITYIKLEEGSLATKFVPNSYESELFSCQKYYFKIKPLVPNYDIITPIGYAASADTVLFPITVPIQLRTTPSVITNHMGLINITLASSVSANAVKTIRSTLTNAIILKYYLSSSPLTIGDMFVLQCASNDSFIEFDAEIY